jgi:hypothetical protein
VRAAAVPFAMRAMHWEAKDMFQASFRSFARAAHLFPVLVCAACIPVLAMASDESIPTEVHVSTNGSDSNPGTSLLPFKTIEKASQVALPGSIVHVAPGTYTGGFKTTASGAASRPIHYVSDTKWGARLVPPVRSSSDGAWYNTGAHVIIEGFEVDGGNHQSGRPWRTGIYTTGSYSVLKNNYVHDVAWNVPCPSQGGAGIEGDSYYGGTNIDLVGNIVHDIGPAICKFIHGIYQTAPGIVSNNVVYRASGWGIHLWHDANHIIVANNTITGSAVGGILVGGGDYVHTRGPADYITVVNNIVFDNANYGIVETGETGYHNLFAHNLSYRNGMNWRLRTSPADLASVKADPRFGQDPSTIGSAYRLAAGSPAIDAGTDANAPTNDLDGVCRPQGSGYDIGAFEFVDSQRPLQCLAP